MDPSVFRQLFVVASLGLEAIKVRPITFARAAKQINEWLSVVVLSSRFRIYAHEVRLASSKSLLAKAEFPEEDFMNSMHG